MEEVVQLQLGKAFSGLIHKIETQLSCQREKTCQALILNHYIVESLNVQG